MKLGKLGHLATATLFVSISAAIAPASAASIVSVPTCTPHQTVTADLSTATSGVDPHWAVAGSGVTGGPHHTPHVTAWSATGLMNNWIQPSNSSTAQKFIPGDYNYSVQFYLPYQPGRYKILNIIGGMAADDTFTAALNGHMASCNSQHCYSVSTPISANKPVFVQGLNTVTVVVTNAILNNDPTIRSYSGLAVHAILTATCG
jgi:hypothetical protein